MYFYLLPTTLLKVVSAFLLIMLWTWFFYAECIHWEATKGQESSQVMEIIRANKTNQKTTPSGGYILMVETENTQDK